MDAKNNEIKLIVDYSRSLQEMIEATDCDCMDDQALEKHFPLPTELRGKKVEISVKLFHFDRIIKGKYAISEINKNNFRPARPVEVLALVEAYPEIQKEFPIAALGSFWYDKYGFRLVYVLHFIKNSHMLCWDWLDNYWVDNCRFLGVHK
ncbi:hypothetical protein K9M50_03785 [Patescibacteria group bacterium]|nr:hypothetical protein [Patescibacteria group bacterium]